MLKPSTASHCQATMGFCLASVLSSANNLVTFKVKSLFSDKKRGREPFFYFKSQQNTFLNELFFPPTGHAFDARQNFPLSLVAAGAEAFGRESESKQKNRFISVKIVQQPMNNDYRDPEIEIRATFC